MAATPDASGHGFTGTLAGLLKPYQVTSPWSGFGNAMRFVGFGQCGVNCGPWGGSGMPAPSGVGAAALFTMEARVQLTGGSGIFGSVCGGFSASDQPPQLFCGVSAPGNDVQLYWTDDTGVSQEIQGGDLSDRLPHEVACCYDGTTMMLFLDGTMIASLATTGIQAPASGDNFWIGSDDSSEDIRAIIDEVRLSVGASRYTAAGYTPAAVPFTTDGDTTALYHLDTGAAAAPSPQIVKFAPTAGAVGTFVQVYGVGFAGATTIDFNGTSATGSATFLDDNEVDANVPLGATTGPIHVAATSGTLTSASDFVLPTPPVITGMNPNPAVRGATVTLSGSGFVNDPSAYVTGNWPGIAVVTFIDSGHVSFVVPSSADTGDVTYNVSLAGTPLTADAGNLDILPWTFTANDVGDGSEVSLSWSTPSGVSTYDVQRDGTPVATGLASGVSSYTDTGVDPSIGHVYTLVIHYSDGESGTRAASVPANCSYESFVNTDLGVIQGSAKVAVALGGLEFPVRYCGTDGTTDYYWVAYVTPTTPGGQTNMGLLTAPHGVPPSSLAVCSFTPSLVTVAAPGFCDFGLAVAGDPSVDAGPLPIAYFDQSDYPWKVHWLTVSGGTWVSAGSVSLDQLGLQRLLGNQFNIAGPPSMSLVSLRGSEVAVFVNAGGVENVARLFGGGTAICRVTMSAADAWYSPPDIKPGPPIWATLLPWTRTGGYNVATFEEFGGAFYLGAGTRKTGQIDLSTVHMTASHGIRDQGIVGNSYPAIGDLFVLVILVTGGDISGIGDFTRLVDVSGPTSRLIVAAKNITEADIVSGSWTLTRTSVAAVGSLVLAELFRAGDVSGLLVGAPQSDASALVGTAPGLTAPDDGILLTVAGYSLTWPTSPPPYSPIFENVAAPYSGWSPTPDYQGPTDSPPGIDWAEGQQDRWAMAVDMASRRVTAGATGPTTDTLQSNPSAVPSDCYGVSIWFPYLAEFDDPEMQVSSPPINPAPGVVVLMVDAETQDLYTGGSFTGFQFLGFVVLDCDTSGNWTEVQPLTIPAGLPPGVGSLPDFEWSGAYNEDVSHAWVMTDLPISFRSTGHYWKLRWDGAAVVVVADHDVEGLDCNAGTPNPRSGVTAVGPDAADSMSWWDVGVPTLSADSEPSRGVLTGSVIKESPVQIPVGSDLLVKGALAPAHPWGYLMVMDDGSGTFSGLHVVYAVPGTIYCPCCPVAAGWLIGVGGGGATGWTIG